MSEDAWEAITGRGIVLLLAALAVHLGGAVGFAPCHRSAGARGAELPR